ncbi:delta-lactam-biosynthetic de-N-acetylase [Pseudalkalibacillus decolorationis]|uniref:delta-lactam-biosynthetic de-N-acetylase n=1 Tax=Pseudalkalibacillus decolorationis TaxID=163879 RepID=UPI002147EED0|nr:delta-lactam-biosynthetic de-N-acetylase [Pseudalkalibacillus decolorationis]
MVPLNGNAYSNEKHDWFFKRSKDHQPATTESEFIELLKKYNGFFIGDTSEKNLYLTFDNGYENGYTKQVLDVLKEKKVPAAFFVTGHYLKDQPELVQRMVKEGHIVGNHSWHHPDLTTVSNDRLKEELQKVEEAYRKLTGRDDMMFLRPPRGVFSERTLALSEQEGYINVFWSLAYMDWMTDQQKGSDYAYRNIMKQVHPGAIMLLHTVSKDNAEALARVIDDLRKQGYTFKSLNTLVADENLLGANKIGQGNLQPLD